MNVPAIALRIISHAKSRGHTDESRNPEVLNWISDQVRKDGAAGGLALRTSSLFVRLTAIFLLLVASSACNSLRPLASAQPSFHSLDSATFALDERRVPAIGAPTLIVNRPHAASGFDSQRMIYVRQAHRLEYFAHNEWADPPARMIAPMIVAALVRGGVFRAVVPTPSAAAGDLRLDTEIIRLQHDFSSQPSRVRFTLRAYLVNESSREVLAWREFDESVVAASGDPAGGVIAANRAAQLVLEQLAGFLGDGVARWQAAAAQSVR